MSRYGFKSAPNFKSKVQAGDGSVLDRGSDLILHLRANGTNWINLSTGSYESTQYGSVPETVKFNPNHDSVFDALVLDGVTFFGVTGSATNVNGGGKGIELTPATDYNLMISGWIYID